MENEQVGNRTFSFTILSLFFLSVNYSEGSSLLFLSCKTNARVYLAKTGQGPHSS
jgi:hypothetical protein